MSANMITLSLFGKGVKAGSIIDERRFGETCRKRLVSALDCQHDNGSMIMHR
jgi:hypothetical protein